MRIHVQDSETLLALGKSVAPYPPRVKHETVTMRILQTGRRHMSARKNKEQELDRTTALTAEAADKGVLGQKISEAGLMGRNG